MRHRSTSILIFPLVAVLAAAATTACGGLAPASASPVSATPPSASTSTADPGTPIGPVTAGPTTPSGTKPAPSPASSGPAPVAGERAEADGLRVLDREVGTGPEVTSGDRIVVHYVGTLDDGTEFDSSKSRGKPLELNIGLGMVIKGWDRGIVGMRQGGKRRLVIPYPLAYGEEGRPPKIPSKATLTFEIELLEVKSVKSKK